MADRIDDKTRAQIIALRRSGHPERSIAALVGRSKGTVANVLKAADAAAVAKVSPAKAKKSKGTAKAPSKPEAAPETGSADAVFDELLAVVDAKAAAAAEADDVQRLSTLARLGAAMRSERRKAAAAEGEKGEGVFVSKADMEAAAERARTKLRNLIDATQREHGGPPCPCCGAPTAVRASGQRAPEVPT